MGTNKKHFVFHRKKIIAFPPGWTSSPSNTWLPNDTFFSNWWTIALVFTPAHIGYFFALTLFR